jgi:prostaglandin-H2 D-isomerase / glutathione transferase
MGQLPILEVDGKIMHQSISICRYLAKKVGLAGSIDLESFDIDSVVDTCNDLRLRIKAKIREEQNAESAKETLTFYLKRLEAIAKENNGHLALNKLTWADLWFTAVLDYLKLLNERDILDGYPNLQQVVDNTLAIENIKNWVKIRPITYG